MAYRMAYMAIIIWRRKCFACSGFHHHPASGQVLIGHLQSNDPSRCREPIFLVFSSSHGVRGIPGARYLVPGTWYLVPGTRYQVPGTWQVPVPGTQYQVPGTACNILPCAWYQVLPLSHSSVVSNTFVPPRWGRINPESTSGFAV